MSKVNGMRASDREGSRECVQSCMQLSRTGFELYLLRYIHIVGVVGVPILGILLNAGMTTLESYSGIFNMTLFLLALAILYDFAILRRLIFRIELDASADSLRLTPFKGQFVESRMTAIQTLRANMYITMTIKGKRFLWVWDDAAGDRLIIFLSRFRPVVFGFIARHARKDLLADINVKGR